MSDIIHLTDENFSEHVLNAQHPVLVDFWAPWCGPCKMIAPILDELAKEYEGKLTIAKINIDENEQSAPQYGVRGIPALIIFKEGQVAGMKVGSHPKGEIKAFINETIGLTL